MKLGGRKNLFAVLVMICMMLTSNVIQAQPAGGASRQSSGNAGGHKHGIPSGSWGGSTDVTSSRSTREVTEGRPGQWSPKAPPLQTAGSTNKGGNESRKLGEAANPNHPYRHGIPSSSWSQSVDETSSSSTREVYPGKPGQWSPKTPPLQDEKGRKLAENNAEPDGGYEYPEDIDYPYDEQFDEDSNDATRGLQESYYYYEYTTTDQPDTSFTQPTMMGDDGSGFTYTEQYNTNYEFTDDFQTRQPMQPTTFQNTNTQTSSAQASQAAKTQAAKAQASKPAPKPEQPKSVAKPEPPKAAPPKPEPPKPVAKPEPPKPVAKPEPPKPVVKPEPPKAAPPKPEPPKPEPPKPEPPKPTPTPKNETTQQVTKEDKINIPQVKYVQLDQFKSGTFELPIVRRASVTKGSTVENTVIIPQIGFVDLCQDHPTTEHEVNLITVHTVTVQQIVPTNECDVELIQVHTVWIPIMGDINIVQHRTKSRRVHLKQEWDCSIKCEDTRIHFLQLPQRDEGIKGTVVVSGTQDDSKSCYSCHSSKCAGVGPALLPIFMDETTPVSRPAPVVQAPKPAPPPKPEIQYVEVIKEVCTKAPEPTEIHHITLGMCPCQEQTVAAPLMFAEQTESTAYAGAFKWWMFPLILLGLLLLSMLLAWLLCLNRNKVEKVQVEKKPESPQKKFIIEKKTKEEDEEEIEREIARTLQARVEANKREQVPAPVVREEEKKVEVKQQVPAAAKQEAAPAAAQDANRALQESPGGSQNSEGRQRSSRGSGSSKKVVKKRIVKMMKQGKLVAEKEEILDEEGNVIRTEIRKEGLSSGSPNRSQP